MRASQDYPAGQTKLPSPFFRFQPGLPVLEYYPGTCIRRLRTIPVIKIGPLVASEYKQAVALLTLHEETVPDELDLTDQDVLWQSLAIWQHWMPCHLHAGPSIYVAREQDLLLGVVCLSYMSRSRGCWRVDRLVVHPDHRGRGIAQELLRYVFAQFGSQGVRFFMAEVPALNDAALSLFASCGFCRSSLITFYRFSPAYVRSWGTSEGFRLALPHMQQQLYQLHCEVLPPPLRQALALAPEDFQIKERVPFTSVERSKGKLMRNRVWSWVSEDTDRRVLTSAVKITAKPTTGYKLEFAVHPGWKELAEGLVRFTLDRIAVDAPPLPVWAKVYDFQGEVHEALGRHGFERSGEAFLLCREHWMRQRDPRPRSTSALPLTNPAINFPLATD